MGENERDLNLSDVLDAGFARTAEEMPEDVTENAAQPVEGAAADTAAVAAVCSSGDIYCSSCIFSRGSVISAA